VTTNSMKKQKKIHLINPVRARTVSSKLEWMRDNIKNQPVTLSTTIGLYSDSRPKAMLMSKKKKKRGKVEHGDTEKALEEDKAYSTRELEEDF